MADKKKAGRKTKLTEELIEKARKWVAAGNYTVTVCNYLGISEPTWYAWYNDGQRAAEGLLEKGEKITHKTLKVKFFKAIKEATAEAEMRNVQLIQSAAKDTWQAAAWYLERKFKDRWAAKQEIKHSGHIAESETDELEEELKNDPEGRELLKKLYRRKGTIQSTS